MIRKKMNINQHKTQTRHKDFNLSIKHGFNEVAKTMQTLLANHWQFGNCPDERHPFFKIT